VVRVRGAGDGHDVVALTQHLSEGKLGRRCVLVSGQALYLLHKVQVLLKVLVLEPGVAAAPVVLGQVLGRLEAARKVTPRSTARWRV